ncbi:hypothetical protein [Methylobacterium aerolatum]|uniref:Uncharacterized protein n=1 Tax=Methylobacterium aerolatum TaxID=418708 RepID=A0ABU0I0N0_9HYPH|nr:hypothetical protein [Methylobacterium aerolatum]MDQ0448142.1 hypothetical protein [Methylobacterium aerolatum]
MILRAAIVVAALYALALQSILGGVAAADHAGPRPRLCAQGADHGGEPGRPAPPHALPPCCTAALPAFPALEPDPATPAVVRPVRPSIGLAWRKETAGHPRTSPRALPQARGPPTA